MLKSIDRFKSAFPNLFGIKDWFRGRQFFHGHGVGVGGRQSSSEFGCEQEAEGAQALAHCSPPAVDRGGRTGAGWRDRCQGGRRQSSDKLHSLTLVPNRGWGPLL